MIRMTPAWALATITALSAPGAAAAQSEPAAVVTLPEAIPIFPLGDALLFPNSTRALHIFEPRYRAMVADALDGDSIIGMVHLQPGYEAEYQGRPPIYAVGCAGRIVSVDELPDGRYNIVLRGMMKFRVLSEDASRPYRLAGIEALPEGVAEEDRATLARSRRRLEELLRSAASGAQLPAELPDEEVVDMLAGYLPFAPLDRQELLEAPGPVERASRLIRLLGGAADGAADGATDGAAPSD